MRMLQLTDENREKARKVVEYAERPENRYLPGKTNFIPGNKPEFVAQIDTFRCVFTITELNGHAFRHLSMSVPKDGAYPNPTAAFTIATWFGFTGAEMDQEVAVKPGSDWEMGASEIEMAIVFAQELPAQP